MSSEKRDQVTGETKDDTTPSKDLQESVTSPPKEVTPPQGPADNTSSIESLFTPPSHVAPKTVRAQPSEDDNLNFIKEQLSILNNESGELTTPIHKSNKQKRHDLAKKHHELAVKRKDIRSPAKQLLKLHCRGVKRSPQKIKPRKPKRVRRSIGFTEKSPGKDNDSSGADADTSDDSSSEDNWKIIESSDNDIDKALEENATKQNLTAVNVRNILHQVITNEDVVAMVKNTLHEITEEDSECSLLPATYEPKMTRSKFKEVLEKDGTINHPWPLSPLKKQEKPKTTFLELPFLEDDEEEDDEYNPEKELDLGSYSDEDSESVTSSHVSDFGSPRPSTPATPSSVSRFSDLDKTPSVQGDEEQLKSPMGPPTKLPLSSQKTMLGKRFHTAMAESDRKAKQKEEETIALRTRSKLSLTETSLLELESSFVAPDITWDMYDTSCDDREWSIFLNGLQIIPENEDTNDDDNDPEYNYLAEAEEEDIDMEDFRCDRAVQVSRKEMNELMDELLEAYQDTDDMEEKELLKKKVMDSVRISTKKSTKTTVSTVDIGLTESQRIQLDHQMRKHVQILTQMYVLAAGNTQDYQEVKDHSKFLLNEIYKFSQVNSTMTTFSAYKACNLEEAVALVNEDRQFTQLDPKNIIVNIRRLKKQPISPSKRGRKSYYEKDPIYISPEKGIENMLCKSYKLLSKTKKDMIYNILGEDANLNQSSLLVPKSTLPILTTQQKDLFWKSLIFIYPEYIPHGNLLVSRDCTKSPRVCFTEAEDNLLALGFQQFRNLPLYRRLIQKSVLPCKTEDQIKIRIKNLTAKNSPDNPIKTYKTEKKLPDFPEFANPFDINDIKPIMQQDASVLPIWCKEIRIKEIISTHDDELDGCNSIQRSSSVNIPVVQMRLGRLETNKSLSAPNTPLPHQEPTKSAQPSALKILQFDPVSQSVTSTSPKVTQLQDIGRKRCDSPGFIKLHEDLPQASPETDFNTNHGRDTAVDISTDSTHINLSMVPISTCTSSGQTSTVLTASSTSVVKSGAIMIMHGQTPMTCAAPIFVVVNKMARVGFEGHGDSTILSSALPSSICSVVQVNMGSSDKVISPTNVIDNISKEVQNELTPPKITPAKRAADIIASYAPYYLSPELIKDTSPCRNQEIQEMTPTKKSPSSRYRPVAPKPIILSTFTSPVKKVSPFLEKKKLGSPRRRQLQTKALSIRPKGFVPNRPHVSPVKKAASHIINRALKRPKTLLPRPIGMVPRPFHLHVRKSQQLEDNEEEDISYLHELGTSGSEGMDTDYMSGDCIDTMDMDENKLFNNPSVFSNRQKHNSGSNRSVESDDTQSEADDVNLYDSQNEDDVIDDEDHLADLMTASTTICFASQRQSAKDKENRKKGIKKKDTTLAMLAPDLLQVDPHKDDRDTAFAQAYLNRTKEALKNDLEKYEQFLRILYDFGKSEQSPVKLYEDLQALLADHPDLVSDFAGFLLPEQATECGCLMAAQEFKRAKVFLRKLEVYLARHPSHYQKVMKIFSRWSKSEKKNVKELREALEPMLKMQPHLLDELSLFFEDERPPESYMTDYEEITLDDSDIEPDPDGYEVIELPDEPDIYGTKMCHCSCHENTLDQNYLKRNRHCYKCCLKVIDGELYFRVSNKVLKKVNVIYHKPIKARSREVSEQTAVPKPAWEEDDPIAEKENVDISLLPFNMKPNGSKKKKDKSRYVSGSDTYLQLEQDRLVCISEINQEHLVSPVCNSEQIQESDLVSAILNQQHQETGLFSSGINKKHLETDPVSSKINLEHKETDLKSSVNIGGINQVNQERDLTSAYDSKVNQLQSETDIIADNTGEMCIQNKFPEVNLLNQSDDANISPKKSESTAEITSSSSSTFPYTLGDSTTCPDILAKALKVAMISQGDVTMDTIIENGNQIQNSFGNNSLCNQALDVNTKPIPSRSDKHFVKELFATSSDSSDSNIKTIVTMADEMSNIGVIKSLDPSENPADIISTIARSEDSTLSQFDSKNGSSSLKERLPSLPEEEEIEKVNSPDISKLPFKTFGKDVKNVAIEFSSLQTVESKIIPKSFKPTVSHVDLDLSSKPTASHVDLDLSRSNSRLSETKNIESPKSIISITHPEIESSVIGFSADSNGSGSMLSENTEINRLTPRHASETKVTVEKKGDNSVSASSDVSGLHWNKDSDRMILEAVKANGPGSDTFNKVSQQLPGRTPQQVQASAVFHRRLEKNFCIVLAYT